MSRKPSPALVVSIIALIVAMSGTAVAARALITSTSQIKNGSIRGVDIRKGTITKKRLSPATVRSLTSQGAANVSPVGAAANEAHRLAGPEHTGNDPVQVVELALNQGVYAVFAKTTISPVLANNDLLTELFRENKTVAADCTLDVNGTGDFAIQPIASVNGPTPATLNTQLTRTIDGPGKATLTCKTSQNIRWVANNSSIIAVKVGSTTRTEVP